MDMSSVEMYEAMAHTVNVAHGERAVGAATAVMISPLVQKLYYVGTMTERTKADLSADRKSYDLFCPIARALDLVGDRWTLLILRDVSLFGPRRFGNLRSNLHGIPPTLLSNRLKALVAEGILERTEHDEGGVTYSFTDRGREIRPVLAALRDFGAPLMPAGWEKKVPPQVFRRR